MTTVGNHLKITALVITNMFVSMCAIAVENNSNNNRLNVLNEYRRILSDEQFAKMLLIYSNESMTPLEKEKEVVNYFSSLPQRIKSRLPVPIPFRSLNRDDQQNVKTIYYAKGVDFKEKLDEIKQFVESLYYKEDDFKKVNDDPDSEFVEFNVNATIKLSGFYRREDLKNHLDDREIEKIDEILSDNSLSHEEKSTKIGEALRQIFRAQKHDANEWPSPIGMESLPSPTQEIIAKILFSEKPVADVKPLFDLYYRHKFDLLGGEKSKGSRARRHIINNTIRRMKKDEVKLVVYDRPQIFDNYEK